MLRVKRLKILAKYQVQELLCALSDYSLFLSCTGYVKAEPCGSSDTFPSIILQNPPQIISTPSARSLLAPITICINFPLNFPLNGLSTRC